MIKMQDPVDCFEFQHGTIHYRGMIPPFWNPFKLLDLNHIIRTIDKMAQEVCIPKKNILFILSTFILISFICKICNYTGNQ